MLKNLLSIVFFLVVANASAQRINESCEEYHNSGNFIETKNDSSRGKFRPVKWGVGCFDVQLSKRHFRTLFLKVFLHTIVFELQ